MRNQRNPAETRHVRSSSRLRRSVGLFLATTLTMVALAGLGSLLLRWSAEARAVVQFVAHYRVCAYLAQLLLTLSIWCFWRRAVALLVARALVPASAQVPLLKKRSRWCGMLLAAQLLLLASALTGPR